MNTHTPTILAIESAIEGGSLALLNGQCEVNARTGSSGVSRAEDLLVGIHELLESNNLSPNDLDIVAASAGPGSFTGLRIGIATALGLARGAGAKFASMSLLHACARARSAGDNVLVALPVGRGSVAIQRFTSAANRVEPLAPPEVVEGERLANAAVESGGFRILAHPTLVELIGENVASEVIGPNLALDLGRQCAVDPIVTEPLFLSRS